MADPTPTPSTDPTPGGEPAGTDPTPAPDTSAGDGQEQDGQQQQQDGDEGRAGGEAALRADLARERKRRQAAERAAREAQQQTESDTEAREREIREQAQAPAVRALRATAVETAATAAGFLYPTDVFALLTAEERDSIDVDLDGDTPAADRDRVAELVKTLAKRRPGLIRPAEEPTRQAGAGGADLDGGRNGSQQQGSSDPNVIFRNALRSRRR